MLAVNRRAQICRCLQGTVELMQLLKVFSSRARQAAQQDAQQQQQQQQQRATAGGTASAIAAAPATGPQMRRLLAQAIPALHMKAQSVAELISSERHYMVELSPAAAAAAAGAAATAATASEEPVFPAAAPPSPAAAGAGVGVVGASYDPRYLVFEFAYSLLLRQSQVSLLRQFRDSVRAGRSLCHQMIMGAGKTTVIAPLLALLLADGERLIVSVVPPALLHFSRCALRERFSAIFQKGVYVLSFSRNDAVSPALYLKLLQTRDSRGIVISTPTAIKSFLLKALHLMHVIQAAAAGDATKGVLAQGLTAAGNLGASQLKKIQSQLTKFLRMQKAGLSVCLSLSLSIYLFVCLLSLLCLWLSPIPFFLSLCPVGCVSVSLHSPVSSYVYYVSAPQQQQQQQQSGASVRCLWTSVRVSFCAGPETSFEGLNAESLSSPQSLTERQLRSCRRELDMSLRVLELFKSGLLIVDEIDEILQPLKSELHWPIGQRQPLDFTSRQTPAAAPATPRQQQAQKKQQQQKQSAAAAAAAADGVSEALISPRQTEQPLQWLFGEEEGMRWQLPWFLLDAIFYFYR